MVYYIDCLQPVRVDAGLTALLYEQTWNDPSTPLITGAIYIHLGSKWRSIVYLLSSLINDGSKNAIDGTAFCIGLYKVLHNFRPNLFKLVPDLAYYWKVPFYCLLFLENI